MHRLAFIENIFFLILIALVGLIRWISQVAENKKIQDAAKRANPQTSSAPLPRAPAQTEEERIRRFMEALGVPTSTAAPPPPPPTVQRREVTPKIPRGVKRKIRPVDPFPRPRVGPWSSEPVVVGAPSPVVVATPPPILETSLAARETTAFTPASRQRTAPEFEVQVVGAPATATSFSRADQDWAGRLTTAGGLRDAIILREIFGPPRSMRSVEEDLPTRI